MTKDDMIKWIDSATYEMLLQKWRFAPSGSPFFEGEVGDYYSTKMREKREEIGINAAASASKAIGWGD